MSTWIAFLRAVNVGKRQVKMEVLRDLLRDSGFHDVETYIASGNVRVTSSTRSAAKVEQDLRRVISEGFGFDVPVVVRTPAQLTEVAAAADSLECPIEGAAVGRYVTFMTGDLDPDGVKKLHEFDSTTEAARVIGKDVVLFLASGVQGAKLSNARIEKLTGAVGTARNITVVRTLATKWGR